MERNTTLKLGTRLLVLFCLMGAGLIFASVLSRLVAKMGLLAMLTVQDVIAFIAPAIAAMAIFYRRPLHVMCLDRFPSLNVLLTPRSRITSTITSGTAMQTSSRDVNIDIIG